MNDTNQLLTRGIANIIPGKSELEILLKSNKKLNIYMGIDPTTTKIHLGHTVDLRKLHAFAKLEHNVTFLIGDFTGMIGDPTDKSATRTKLSPDEVKENSEDFVAQIKNIFNFFM